MTEERDPRANPQPGDELRIWHGGRIPWLRKVKNVVSAGWFDGVIYETSSGGEVCVSLSKWRKVMRNAEVLKRG